MLRICTFTDFGFEGPYLGQLENRVAAVDATISVTHLVADAPAFEPRLAGRLLAAVAAGEGPAVFLGVVDPGVGGRRQPVAVNSGEQWFVGPDNGLFAPIVKADPEARIYRILYRPESLSETFHGRDLFAPVAARLAASRFVALEMIDALEIGPGDCLEGDVILYADSYGNLMTTISGDELPTERMLVAGGREILHAPRFDSVKPGDAFWYVNSLGLVEIAVNQGSARHVLGLEPGDPVDRA